MRLIYCLINIKQLFNGSDQGACKIILSRARHPQTNDKVNQSNQTVAEMLAALTQLFEL